MALENWKQLSQPPQWALKEIQAGRLKGKSDINPQWRYQAMTEVYGECGSGWKYTIDALWNEDAAEGQRFAFARISLQVMCSDGQWSDPIPGIGGHMLLQKEKSGIHVNDEAYKMAVTDALSTAMKMIGVAADVYAGLWDGAKYTQTGPAARAKGESGDSQPTQKPQNKNTNQQSGSKPQGSQGGAQNLITDAQKKKIGVLGSQLFHSNDEKRNCLNNWLANQGYEQVSSASKLTKKQATEFIKELEAMKEVQDQEKQEAENATAYE